MIYYFLFVIILINYGFSDNLKQYSYDNNLSCSNNKICIPVDYCTDIMVLLNDATLPIQQFRQSICGYVGKNPKICCNTTGYLKNFIHNNYPMSLESSQDCGKNFIRSNAPTIGSFPFLARIGFINLNDGNVKYSCTGTIINERTILSTATCALATANNYKLHSVLIGEFDTANNPDCNELFCAHCTRSYNISYIIKHPNFHRDTYNHNIALIRLSESITFTLTVQPICYLNQHDIIMDNVLTLVGWGKLSRNRDSTVQHASNMKIINEHDCNEYRNRNLNVELCAIGNENPCSGFSGSPLIHYDRHDRYTVIGILSYGLRCNLNDNSPSVFVNIEKYSAWISENS